MNELQEAVLDALMVTDKIGHELRAPGPLSLAAKALHAAGLLGKVDLKTVKANPGAYLGYPLVLCAAVEAAARTLRGVDECRKLTISLFSEVPPRDGVPKLKGRQLVEAARWSLERLPALVRGLPKLADETFAALDEYLGGKPCPGATIDKLGNALAVAAEQVNGGGGEFVPGRLALDAHYYALHTLRRDQCGDDPTVNACRVTREVARLVGMVEGVGGAIPYCLGLARQLGL
jgi:hypothetical protein